MQALLPDPPVASEAEGAIKEIEIASIKANPQQPRREFNEEKLAELAASIKEHGLVQPVVVRLVGEDSYELIAGERRWRASQRLGLTTIPAVIKDISDIEVTELSLVENIQREDLNPLEEAIAYRRLMREFGFTQEKLSERLSKSRSYIANAVRLLNLPAPLQEMLANGQLSAGHAKALLGLIDEKQQLKLANLIVQENLTVREIEAMVQKANLSGKEKRPPKPRPEGPVMHDIEERLREIFGTKVNVKSAGKGGRIEINYYSEEELARIIEMILNGREL